MASVEASCCTVRSELPAIVVDPAVANPNPIALPVSLVPPAAAEATFQASAAATVVHHSPPAGKSILRI